MSKPLNCVHTHNIKKSICIYLTENESQSFTPVEIHSHLSKLIQKCSLSSVRSAICLVVKKTDNKIIKFGMRPFEPGMSGKREMRYKFDNGVNTGPVVRYVKESHPRGDGIKASSRTLFVGSSIGGR